MVRELTYFAPRNCYKKKRNGQTFYVGKGSDRDSDVNYRRAWQEWEQKLSELVAAEAEQRRQNASYVNADGMSKYAFNAAWPQAQPGSKQPHAADETRRVPDGRSEAGRWVEADRKSDARHAADEMNVADIVAKFIAHKTTQARTGRLKGGGRVANLSSSLKTFAEFVGNKQTASRIGQAVTLADYYTHLSKLAIDEAISSTTAAEKMQAAKQLIRWGWELGLCELPRNIDSREQVIFRSIKPIKPMPLDLLRKFIKAATGRLKLELLLMANCGFYQSDCAELRHTECDFGAGTITRKRSKRAKGRDKDVPEVTYHLWPSTLAALKAHASMDGELVLPNGNGAASVRSYVNAEGKAVRIDNFRMSYDRFRESLAKDDEQIAKADSDETAAKCIRKASATEIGNSKDYSRFAQYFLGQSPRTVADKHYVKPSEEQFRDCLKWLGKHLQIDEPEKIGRSRRTR